MIRNSLYTLMLAALLMILSPASLYAQAMESAEPFKVGMSMA